MPGGAGGGGGGRRGGNGECGDGAGLRRVGDAARRSSPPKAYFVAKRRRVGFE